jgi:hypothetical protein
MFEIFTSSVYSFLNFQVFSQNPAAELLQVLRAFFYNIPQSSMGGV